ncbi:sigma-54 interaction domain-containing protein [Paraburkholderia rhizosphaerae]|uniref:DNA-binding NtrC family response regulator n=1 Tax=Paraburkholderia rhizosphaerae TaxID=480658 RepID=A0A4R8LT81_9BURK|nr:sigma-54 dependent transcriptional regulator [Paraburkholderia rhizosphaerae]TDY50900.1 DNA-binding NtrC family response regulator [Paraburkholderia rhizosphaerae]
MRQSIRHGSSQPARDLEPRSDGSNLIGQSPAFLHAMELIRKSAQCGATVLIEGETGTGKELAARAIHYMSARHDAPFIPINCGAIPDHLLESELYGHERGAFTDAREASVGLVAQADGGSLLLDEIEAMSPRAQIVLLRFLQDHHYRMVGGKVNRRANIRVIASSNADVEALTRTGSFRSDLYFRLNVLAIRLPSLRERDGDAVLLAREFCRRLSERYEQPLKELHDDTIAFLQSYAWPGNVRELENMIHREYVFGSGPFIRLTHASRHRLEQTAWLDARPQDFKSAKAAAVRQFERTYLHDVLSRTGGNISAAARMAGKERSAFCRLIRKHAG